MPHIHWLKFVYYESIYCKTYIYWQTSNTAVHYGFISRGRGPPPVFFPVADPDERFLFFCVFEVKHDEEMVGDHERRQPGGEFESTTGSVQTPR
jgi:hypothetical protein